MRTATDNNGVKNKVKNDKVFSNYKTDNITGVEVVYNQSERKRSVEGRIQRKKSYEEILKTDRNTAGKLEQNRNEGAADIVANKGSVGADFKVNGTHVTNNRVQRMRLKIAKPKIVDSCELGDTNNVSLASEIVRDYKRGNFKAVTSPSEFMSDSAYLMNHSEVQKKVVETFNSQDKKLLVLENVSEDDDSLNLQNGRISNKAIENVEIREGVETSKKMVLILIYHTPGLTG